MQLFANAQDFQAALSQVIQRASQPNPSRYALAADLDAIAVKLGAKAKAPKAPKEPKAPKAPGSRTRKKAPGGGAKAPEAPRSWGRQTLVNIAQVEQKALDYLKDHLGDAMRAVDKELDYIRDEIAEAEIGEKEYGRVTPQKDIDALWERSTVGIDILNAFANGVDMLHMDLEAYEDVTLEHDLVAAVEAFKKAIPKHAPNLPKGTGEKLFKDLSKAIANAVSKVPTTGLSKPSELGRLRDTFDAMADAIKLLTGKAVSVPKIPKALAPEDPRQLGFGFTASARIANSDQLKDALYVIERMAHQHQPSRAQLAEAVSAVSAALRR